VSVISSRLNVTPGMVVTGGLNCIWFRLGWVIAKMGGPTALTQSALQHLCPVSDTVPCRKCPLFKYHKSRV